MSYTFPEFTKGQIGEFSYDQLNAAFAILEEVGPMLPFLRGLRKRSKVPNVRPWFEHEITGHTLIPDSTNRWLYSWRRVSWNPNDRKYVPMMKPVVSGGGDTRTPPPGLITPGTTQPPKKSSISLVEINSTINGDPFALAAINGCENANVNDGMVGPGVDTGASSYTGCNLEVKPISNGVVVPMFHSHGMLSRDQVTGERSVFAYMFSLGNAHDKVGAP